MKKETLIIFATCLLLFSAVYADVRTGTIVAAPVTVGDSSNTFPTAYEDEINGGYKIVSTPASRDAIALSRRVIGMMCYVTTEATTYRLVGGTGNTNWTVVPAGGTGGWINGGGQVTLETISNNVGIGTTSPQYSLHVLGGGILYQKSGTGISGYRLADSSMNLLGGLLAPNNGIIDLIASAGGTGEVEIITNGVDRMRISKDGNVGIGTTNPTSKMQVDKGSLLVSGNFSGGNDASIFIGDSNNWVRTSTNNPVEVSGWNGVRLCYATDTVPTHEVMRATNNGRVGIGSSLPVATLEVNGDIRLTAIPTPSAGTAGRIYFSSATNRLNYSDGTQWIELDPAYTTREVLIGGGISTETGTVTYSPMTISGFFTTPTNNDVIMTSVGFYSEPGDYSVWLDCFMKIELMVGSTVKAAWLYYVKTDEAYSSYYVHADSPLHINYLPIPVKIPRNTSVSMRFTKLGGSTNVNVFAPFMQYILLPF